MIWWKSTVEAAGQKCIDGSYERECLTQKVGLNETVDLRTLDDEKQKRTKIMAERKRNSNALEIEAREGEGTEEALFANTILRPTVQAGRTIKQYDSSGGHELDITELVKALGNQTSAVIEGDLGRSEAMLVAQAHTLDVLFNKLAQRAYLNMGEYMGAVDTYLKLALRAQSQCRATWETISTIKNPPVAKVVKQANIAHGPQQVNNTPPAKAEPSRVGENQNSQNQLLEKTDGNRLDTGTTCAAIEADKGMETLGEINRAEDVCR